MSLRYLLQHAITVGIGRPWSVTVEPAHPTPTPPVPIPPPSPGARVRIYKQDPSVAEVGIEKLSSPVYSLLDQETPASSGGLGIPPVSPNLLGDFIQTPNSAPFDAVHTFAVVRMTLTMYQRAIGGAAYLGNGIVLRTAIP